MLTDTLPARQSVVVPDLAAAVESIEDGMAVALGGFTTSGRPAALVRALVRRGARNLTVLGGAAAGLDVDLLIGAGCVKRVVAPYVGAEAYGPIGPFFRHAAERGTVDVWECDEGMYYAGLRAAAAQLPFAPWRSGVGTSIPELNPDLRPFRDPIRGELLLAVPALRPDVALLHAGRADPYGNVQHTGHPFGDRAAYRAAGRTIVQVDRVISNEELRRAPENTSLAGVDVVVRAPYGAHPFASPGHYREDPMEIGAYMAAARAATQDDNYGPFDRWLQERVFEPVDHVAYLDRIGLRQLLALDDEEGA